MDDSAIKLRVLLSEKAGDTKAIRQIYSDIDCYKKFVKDYMERNK